MSVKDILRESFNAAKRRKNLIVFYAAAQIVFLIFGQWMVAEGFPGVIHLRDEQLREIQNLPYLKPLTGLLANSLILKILYTFFFNLVFGAFLSTTVTGIVFFLPYIIAVWRSFLIGVLISGMDVSPGMIAVFYGTYILEFGAYCISSAVGTDIGLALLWPLRKGTHSRKEAFSIAVRDGGRLYILVALVLFISAIWEISWLHYLGPLMKPGLIK